MPDLIQFLTMAEPGTVAAHEIFTFKAEKPEAVYLPPFLFLFSCIPEQKEP